jgi:hypothetical protein
VEQRRSTTDSHASGSSERNAFVRAAATERRGHPHALLVVAIHGNGFRGIVTKSGKFRVVGACRFSHLVKHHKLDWLKSEHMQGDRWATKHGCH